MNNNPEKCPRHYPITDCNRVTICTNCGKQLSETYLKWRRTRTANLVLRYAHAIRDFATLVNQAYPEIDTTDPADTSGLEACAALLKAINKSESE